MNHKVKLPRKPEDLNLDYLKRQGKADEANINALLRAYSSLEDVLNGSLGHPTGLLPKSLVASFNELVERHEYLLQVLWGFPRDASRHTYWLVNPRCSCPKMDNNELVGTGTWWYDAGCPYHGAYLDDYDDEEVDT